MIWLSWKYSTQFRRDNPLLRRSRQQLTSPETCFFGSREKLRCKLPTLEATHITNQNWQPPPPPYTMFLHLPFFLLGFFCGVAGLRLTVTRIKGQPCLSIAARMAQMHLKESMRLSDGAERWNIRLLLVFSAAACQSIATPVVIYPRVPSDKV